jgi:hypothetical protein
LFGAPQASALAPFSSQAATAQAGDINGSSVIANFDKVILDGQGDMSFFHTLQNHTPRTILIQSNAAVTIAALMRNPASGQVDQTPLDSDYMRVTYPISMPPGHAATLVMRGTSLRLSPSRAHHGQSHPAHLARCDVRLRALVRKHSPRLEGRLLTDSALNLRVNLPPTR